MRSPPRIRSDRVALQAWAAEHADEYAFFAVLIALVQAGHLRAEAGPDGRWWADPTAIRAAYDAHGDEVRYISRELLDEQRKAAGRPPQVG